MGVRALPDGRAGGLPRAVAGPRGWVRGWRRSQQPTGEDVPASPGGGTLRACPRWPGADMAGLLGQPPAALPLDARQQPEHERAGRGLRLNPSEPARDPGHGLVELLPTGSVYAAPRGHRTIFRSQHNPR